MIKVLLSKFSTEVKKISKSPMYYNLGVIISAGYRVKSNSATAFRRWANSVLQEYIIKEYAVNYNRMNQLNEAIRVMRRV